MTDTKVRKARAKQVVIRRRLLAVVPWSAGGPGWTNAGLHAYYEDIYEDGTVKTSEEWVYEKDLAPEERVVFRISLEVYEVLSRRFRKMESTQGNCRNCGRYGSLAPRGTIHGTAITAWVCVKGCEQPLST